MEVGCVSIEPSWNGIKQISCDQGPNRGGSIMVEPLTAMSFELAFLDLNPGSSTFHVTLGKLFSHSVTQFLYL